ncbi:MAG: hypothetical protein JWN25_2914 [Verrucomicrobiales bacterium]|nr:hypothetical protein [Verrucomicrobiales bacterium]
MSQPILSLELMRKLEQFQLTASRKAFSSFKGERRSQARGISVEFADFRNYVAGDDFRYLDWNLFGRLDRLYLKLYEEERELPVRIFLDCSKSMDFGSPAKFDFARQLGAAIGYTTLVGFDRVSFIPLPSEAGASSVVSFLRALRGRKQVLPFLKSLELLKASGSLAFDAALRKAALETRQVGLAVVISDFLDPQGYAVGLNALVARGFKILVIQVLSPEELDPSTFGDLRLIDSETGSMQEVTFGKYRLDAYKKTVANYCQVLREFCGQRGIAHFLFPSNASLEQVLLKDFRKAKIWG